VALITIGACPALAPGHSPTLAALATVHAVARNCRRLRRSWVPSPVVYPWALAVPVFLPRVMAYPPHYTGNLAVHLAFLRMQCLCQHSPEPCTNVVGVGKQGVREMLPL
jgi:hypothetical protein